MPERLLEIDPEQRSALVRFFAFNTLVSITAYGDEGDRDWKPHLTDTLIRAHGACMRYEGLFSRTLATSDVGRLNEAQGAWVEVDPDTYEVLKAACAFCEASGGIFDITIGTATALWDFHEGIIPSAEALAGAMGHVGWWKLDLQREAEGGSVRTLVRLSDPMTKVDLGGIAKGWIADRLVELMAQSPVHAGIVDLGGNVAVYGMKPNGDPWRVALRNPHPTEEKPYLEVMDLRFGSVVTSGTTERFFSKGGQCYHHILDTRTGQPRQVPWASASVIADDSLTAEGFSTTMLALSGSEARAMVAAHPEIREVIFVDAEGEILRLS